jgi:cytidylate kinase
VTIVAIDGPAGAGKSTVARAVAKVLGFVYLDTGAMYRALALAALQRGISPQDEDGLAELLEGLGIEARGDRVLLDGEDVSDRIRDADVTSIVSQIAAHEAVRAALVERQREVGRGADVVMAGRDIGATVAPDAALKIWLTASSKERARRRARQLGAEGEGEVAAIRSDLEARDAADARRRVSPLREPSDAIAIDSTGMSIEEVVERVVAAVRQSLG